jgi:hypothetical protein
MVFDNCVVREPANSAIAVPWAHIILLQSPRESGTNGPVRIGRAELCWNGDHEAVLTAVTGDIPVSSFRCISYTCVPSSSLLRFEVSGVGRRSRLAVPPVGRRNSVFRININSHKHRKELVFVIRITRGFLHNA